MALRLELDFDKKKESTPVLDLTRFRITTRQEFDKVFEKVPDYKIKPEKVRYDEVKIQDSHFTFVPPRAEILAGKEAAGGGCATGTPEFPFGNPVPPSMRAVRIEDLSSVDINWRMLTLARPKTKLEEDIFSRFVALDKMKRKTRQAEGDQVPPLKQLIQGKTGKGKNAKSAGRAGGGAGGAVPETRFPSCKDCGEELCSGACKDFHYEAAERMPFEEKEKDGDKQEGLNLSALLDGSGAGTGGRKKKNAQATTKGGPPRMSHLRKKKKKKKKPATEDKYDDDDVQQTVISGTNVLATKNEDDDDDDVANDGKTKKKRPMKKKSRS